MKLILFTLISLFFLNSVSAQITYETPHVKDGKTLQVTLPNGFFKIVDADFEGNTLYTTKEGVYYDSVEKERLNLGMLAIIHEPIEDRTLEDIMEELEADFVSENSQIEFIAKPAITKLKGRDCLNAAFKGAMEGEILSGIYFSAIQFGDFNIITAYYALEGAEDLLAYDEFKKIMGSWKEVETDREDEMPVYEDYAEQFDDVIDETNYLNDLFETSITYYDVLPDYGDNWDEPEEDNTHLLSEFIYKGNHGSIKIFSGGQAANYKNTGEMSKAIQQVLELRTGLSLKLDTEFSNEDHLFKLYAIAGGGTSSSVYTTEVNNELIFFVIDGSENPLPDFKPAVRDFMITMWVDYIDYEDEPRVYEGTE